MNRGQRLGADFNPPLEYERAEQAESQGRITTKAISQV